MQDTHFNKNKQNYADIKNLTWGSECSLILIIIFLL